MFQLFPLSKNLNKKKNKTQQKTEHFAAKQSEDKKNVFFGLWAAVGAKYVKERLETHSLVAKTHK